MNKYTLGVVIPYYRNSIEIENQFKLIMEKLKKQLTIEIILYVYEDGQVSSWLQKYNQDNIVVVSSETNKGVSFARNKGIDYLIDKCMYITFIDSDDDFEDNYLYKLCEYCRDNTHDIIETKVQVNGQDVDAYLPDKMRNAVWAIAIKTNIIGNHRFDTNLNIQEDCKFVNEVCDLTKYRKKLCPTLYYYRYDVNPNSLVKRYNRKEINRERS